MRNLILISCALALAGCASLKDNPYMEMDCAALAPLAESQMRTGLLDRVDLYNDVARQEEMLTEDSPFRNRVKRAENDSNGTAEDREQMITAYKRKGCAS